jgi:preprotein translocase subunit SecE
MSKNLAQFIRETRQEARKVTWPSQKETVTTTIVVFVMIFIMAVILLAADGVILNTVKFILGLGAKI